MYKDSLLILFVCPNSGIKVGFKYHIEVMTADIEEGQESIASLNSIMAYPLMLSTAIDIIDSNSLSEATSFRLVHSM